MPSNFTFLAQEFPLLFNIAQSAELLYHHDPPSCLGKLRLLGEKLALTLFGEHQLAPPPPRHLSQADQTAGSGTSLLHREPVFQYEGNEAMHEK